MAEDEMRCYVAELWLGTRNTSDYTFEHVMIDDNNGVKSREKAREDALGEFRKRHPEDPRTPRMILYHGTLKIQLRA